MRRPDLMFAGWAEMAALMVRSFRSLSDDVIVDGIASTLTRRPRSTFLVGVGVSVFTPKEGFSDN